MIRIIRPWSKLAFKPVIVNRSFAALANIGFNKTNTFARSVLVPASNTSGFLDQIQQQSIRTKKNSSKGKNSSKAAKEADENEDSEDEYYDLEGDIDSSNKNYTDNIDTSQFQPGFKILEKSVPSMRFDSVISSGLNVSRNKIEDLFYSSRLRLNGEKVTKKSVSVRVGDRLDLIGDMDEKAGKRTLRRVLLENVFEPKSAGKRAKAVMVVWKTGLYEEDAYKL